MATTPSFDLTPKQKELRRLLAGSARHCLIYGGSRSGKTFLLCYAMLTRAVKAPGSRHLILRRYGVAARQSIAKDTMPKVRELAYPDLDWNWRDQENYWTLPNGAEIWVGGLDDKERVDKILGREFATIYENEASEIPYGSHVVAQTRLAQSCKQTDGRPLPLKNYVDLNPTTRQHWTHRLWIDGVRPDDEAAINRDAYVWGVANPTDNEANLPGDYIASLEALPERQRKRFFEGVYSADDENALWRREMFHRIQRDANGEWPVALRRVVVAVDPATTNEPGSDETGIIAVARGADGHAYVLDDASGRYRPEEWARKAIALYREHDADRIVAEKNQGGDMVEAVIRAQSQNVPVTLVHASRGKVVRAEPVAALYERGKVFHCGEFRALEEQMCAFTADLDRKAQGWSPDRVDALVWGVTDLFASLTRKAQAGPISYGKLANVA